MIKRVQSANKLAQIQTLELPLHKEKHDFCRVDIDHTSLVAQSPTLVVVIKLFQTPEQQDCDETRSAKSLAMQSPACNMHDRNTCVITFSVTTGDTNIYGDNFTRVQLPLEIQI